MDTQSFWQLNDEWMLTPTEQDHDWVTDRVMFGSGYNDMLNTLRLQREEEKIDETLYRRRLGAIFSYVMSLISLDLPDREYSDEDGV